MIDAAVTVASNEEGQIDAIQPHSLASSNSSAPPRQSASNDAPRKPHVSMIRADIGFLGNYFGLSAVSPYYGLLFQTKGFSPAVVGLLSAFNPLCTLVLLPPMAYIADRFHCNVAMSIVGIVLSTLFVAVATISDDLWVVAICAVLNFVAQTPIDPFLDNHTMAMLPADQRSEWGSSRSYGAYGWGIGAPLASQCVTWFGWPCIAIQYAVGRVCTGYTFLTTTAFRHSECTSMRYVDVLMFVATHRRMALFLCCVCCMGMGYVLISTFLFLFLKSLGAPDILLGLSITMTVVVEIPLFRYSKALHARFTDRQLFATAALGWVVRVIGYSYLQNPWLVLLLEPLHGLSFGLMWLSGVHLTGAAFPPHLAASAFGFLHASAFGFGPLIGNIVGGQLYEHLGPRWMFRCAAAFMLVMVMVFVTLDRRLEASEHCEPANVDGESPRHKESQSDLREGAPMSPGV